MTTSEVLRWTTSCARPCSRTSGCLPNSKAAICRCVETLLAPNDLSAHLLYMYPFPPRSQTRHKTLQNLFRGIAKSVPDPPDPMVLGKAYLSIPKHVT